MTTTVTKRIGGNATGGATQRITGHASGGQTHRVPLASLLLLEGDQSGCLLLEGDMQSASDRLSLEGDVTGLAGSVTRRVAEFA